MKKRHKPISKAEFLWTFFALTPQHFMPFYKRLMLLLIFNRASRVLTRSVMYRS